MDIFNDQHLFLFFQFVRYIYLFLALQHNSGKIETPENKLTPYIYSPSCRGIFLFCEEVCPGGQVSCQQ
jgi:hypothetical protein